MSEPGLETKAEIDCSAQMLRSADAFLIQLQVWSMLT